MQGIASILKISKSSAENHLHQLGYVHHFDVWVLHKWKKKKNFDHIFTYDSLLKLNENIPFLRQIVKGDEKWILYNKMARKKPWEKLNEPQLTTPKADLYPKKVMGMWWNWKRVLFYELLPENQLIPTSTSLN